MGLDFPWGTFLELQRLSDSHVINARAHAQEEALAEILEDIAIGSCPTDPDAMRQRYRTLAANRTKKFSYRTKVADQVAHHDESQRRAPDQHDLAAFRQLAKLTASGISRDDYGLLVEILGAGASYRESATVHKVPVGTLKARVSRLRSQIRNGSTGTTIRAAFAA
jgi:hypothetical protein